MAEPNNGRLLRLTRIDELILRHHRYLESEDECYYLGEYQTHQGYAAGPTNQLITNLKIPATVTNPYRRRHKERAVQEAGSLLGAALRAGGGNPVTIVPVPPSKIRDHAEYDDRMTRVAGIMVQGTRSEVRELVCQIRSYDSSHTAGAGGRITPEELLEIYEIGAAERPPHETVIVLDDMLTKGAHFRAMKTKILERFPDANVVGVFVARAVAPPAADLASLLDIV